MCTFHKFHTVYNIIIALDVQMVGKDVFETLCFEMSGKELYKTSTLNINSCNLGNLQHEHAVFRKKEGILVNPPKE